MAETGQKATGQTILELDIDELENACKHLERSNKELLEFMEDDPHEALKEAIEENNRAIGNKKKKIDELKRLLLQGSSPHMLGALETNTPEQDIVAQAPPTGNAGKNPVVVNQNHETEENRRNSLGESQQAQSVSEPKPSPSVPGNAEKEDPRLSTGVFL
uniref:REM-1 domain-containing protein n=1 Tax=Aplanochytrium stocchinoi TaxID=215587 RepID=A0A7S3PGX5_9STRA|mmetsp:Transcript_30801/g.38011  ORF Transcript_30801/g.38011 Transcript_30801/m.38011 type:complete len:160 (+) Transcript_30801:103-582(+)|eukprot:CAMPEP_0204837426 /NCGR_PEP_ID=MMETSP1346-20131115/27832_1 /ASSEMBLY_ACC=CAM_ASM_000771 /TAXON_ID=215587 /ORGANISM="Aplanochytrium stocchinoi, Strain GSBS06" /LENGTH=159 /DNA_ID=CAMNT_0051972849 /DNA_START=23 /DNA_END=502 /DNA_ORIENTATION=+